MSLPRELTLTEYLHYFICTIEPTFEGREETRNKFVKAIDVSLRCITNSIRVFSLPWELTFTEYLQYKADFLRAGKRHVLRWWYLWKWDTSRTRFVSFSCPESWLFQNMPWELSFTEFEGREKSRVEFVKSIDASVRCITNSICVFSLPRELTCTGYPHYNAGVWGQGEDNYWVREMQGFQGDMSRTWHVSSPCPESSVWQNVFCFCWIL